MVGRAVLIYNNRSSVRKVGKSPKIGRFLLFWLQIFTNSWPFIILANHPRPHLTVTDHSGYTMQRPDSTLRLLQKTYLQHTLFMGSTKLSENMQEMHIDARSLHLPQRHGKINMVQLSPDGVDPSLVYHHH